MFTNTRSRNLGIAGGLALAAAILTMLSVSRAQGSTTSVSVSSAPVLVATRDLAIGTPVSSALAGGAFALKKLPAESVAPGSVASATGLRGQVVIQPIFKGEQLTASRFGPTAAQGLRANLHGALRAIAVPGDANQLLAGMLQAGDHVDVIANVKAVNGPKTRVSLNNLIVLSPPVADSASTGATAAATLQLTDKQVQTLFWILKNGDWSFVLRPSSKAAVTAVKPTTQADVLAGR
jgi:Flp pilus assembly protein CpaB